MGYAALVLAYLFLLLAALGFAFRGGRVLGVVRPLLTLRRYQLGLSLLLLHLAMLVTRYVSERSGPEAIRTLAAGFLLGAYLLYGYGLTIAGRRGIDTLRSSLINLFLAVGGSAFAGLIVTVYIRARSLSEKYPFPTGVQFGGV